MDRAMHYGSAAINPFKLGRLLHEAAMELYTAGVHVPAGEDDVRPLITRRRDGWQDRVLLLARVFDILQERNSCGNVQDATPEDHERWQAMTAGPAVPLEEDDEELMQPV